MKLDDITKVKELLTYLSASSDKLDALGQASRLHVQFTTGGEQYHMEFKSVVTLGDAIDHKIFELDEIYEALELVLTKRVELFTNQLKALGVEVNVQA